MVTKEPASIVTSLPEVRYPEELPTLLRDPLSLTGNRDNQGPHPLFLDPDSPPRTTSSNIRSPNDLVGVGVAGLILGGNLFVGIERPSLRLRSLKRISTLILSQLKELTIG